QLAIELIRRHRILEVFLVEKLGFGWDEVDEEAEVLEHAVSAQFIERLYRFLGEPEQDPHGSLIPSVTGEWQQHHWLPLDQLPQCQWAKIERVKGFSPEQLRYLDTLGLRPGVCLQLLEAAPFNGPLCLELDGQKVYVDSHMARQIYLSLTLELTT
ncbi:MAG: metal-dependent transcriptional regulator, partial [Moraxella osloensis]|nr:metal-dependent transcriptional regulator [Moraxella osloensis]